MTIFPDGLGVSPGVAAGVCSGGVVAPSPPPPSSPRGRGPPAVLSLPSRPILLLWPPIPLRFRSRSQTGHHMLDVGVLLERQDRLVRAVTGLLEPAVRHLADHDEVAVYPDGSDLEPPCRTERPSNIRGPDGRGEAVGDVVGPGDRHGGPVSGVDRRAADVLLQGRGGGRPDRLGLVSPFAPGPVLGRAPGA